MEYLTGHRMEYLTEYRMNKLMVRQLAQEGESGFHLWLNPSDSHWTKEQFEVLCSTACALAEDLFQAGRLESVRVGCEASISARGLRELHDFFDQLASLEYAAMPAEEIKHSGIEPRNLIVFKPRGEGGVSIHVNGAQAGQA